MAETHTFTTSVNWNAQRKGVLSSPGLSSVEIATPPQFAGGMEGYWSPETLYIASAEACLMATFLAIAEISKLSFTSYSSRATGTVEKREGGFLVTEISIHARVAVPSADLVDRAKRILEKSKAACLISNSMKTEVHLEPEIAVG